jgi:glycosyltransferase involved in cell wall biosynthesis
LKGQGVPTVKPSSAASCDRRLRIGMAVYGDIAYDSRVKREAETLAKAGHHVLLAYVPGTEPNRWSVPGIDLVPLLPSRTSILQGSASRVRRSGRLRQLLAVLDRVRWFAGYAANVWQWGSEVVAAVGRTDAWHLHDLPALIAISGHLRDATPIVYDSHELFLDQGAAVQLPAPIRALLRFDERRRVKRADTLITVNYDLASILKRRYRPSRIVVVHNCPPRTPLYAGPDRLRAAADIPTASPVVLHHGAITYGRGIESLVMAMLEPGLEQAHLVLLGFGPLREAMMDLGRQERFGGRLHVLHAVPPDQLLDWIASADVGAIARPAADINYEMSTPNKLFECMAAGVPVVASGRAVSRIVLDPAGPLGEICDPTRLSSIALAIRSIVELGPAQRAALRDRCRAAAERRWNWERETVGLVATYERIARDRGDSR